MHWTNNVKPFVPQLPFNDDWDNYTIESLKKLSMGRKNAIQVELQDNSMYDRFLKNDIISITIADRLPEDTGEGLFLLPDEAVLFACFDVSGDSITLRPFYEDAWEAKSYALSEVTFLGVPSMVIRA